MVDLSTTYMGLKLKNPLVASPSPLMENIDNIRKLEDAGAAAVVLHSLFEEQITLMSHDLDRFLSHGVESTAEAERYFPNMTDYNLGPDGYLNHLRLAKQAVSIPVIGSLNGVWMGDWTRYARKIEQAGADGIELNVYYIPTDPDLSGGQVEQAYLDLVNDVKSSIRIPVAVKLSPFFSSMANMARRFDTVGADALVLFNRFYQPDFDLETLEVVPNLTLSNSSELRLRLRWVAILYGHVRADMAITGGVHTADDVLKAMMAGANIAMMTSALLDLGIEHVTGVLNNLSLWMEEHDYQSIRQMQGSMSQRSVAEPAAFERANYMKVLRSYSVRMMAGR
ncbi:MAG: dihydroorotate dehydrogenase-like protein [Chloroflexi bacterium]|nr:dihydroorotate dehydrogenase-like protein [Chloroflexota bacterium]